MMWVADYIAAFGCPVEMLCPSVAIQLATTSARCSQGIRRENGRVVAATAMPNNFLINAEIVVKGGEDLDPRGEAFETEFLDVMEQEGDKIEEQDADITVER